MVYSDTTANPVLPLTTYCRASVALCSGRVGENPPQRTREVIRAHVYCVLQFESRGKWVEFERIFFGGFTIWIVPYSFISAPHSSFRHS